MLLTVGHSNHSFAHFARLIQGQAVAAIADVRSAPYSRFNPQFNRETLRDALLRLGVMYYDFGRALGARRHELDCYVNGMVRFERVEGSPLFLEGIDRLLALPEQCVAMLCAEEEPLVCHRMILVSRHLRRRGVSTRHLRGDGRVETMVEAEERLRRLHFPQDELFRSREQLVEDAYALQAERIQYAGAPPTG